MAVATTRCLKSKRLRQKLRNYLRTQVSIPLGLAKKQTRICLHSLIDSAKALQTKA